MHKNDWNGPETVSRVYFNVPNCLETRKNHFLGVISKGKPGTSCSKPQNLSRLRREIATFRGDFKGKIRYFVLKPPKKIAPAAQKYRFLEGLLFVGAKFGLNAP